MAWDPKSKATGPVVPGPVVRQSIMAVVYWRNRAAHLRAAKRQRKRKAPDTPAMTCFIQLGLTFEVSTNFL